MPRFETLASTAVLMCCLSATVVTAAESNGMGLSDVYQLALDKDANWQAAQYGQQASAEVANQARSALKPQVALSAQLGLEDSNKTDPSDQQILSLSVSQSLFNRAAREQAKAAEQSQTQSEYRLSLEQQQLLIDTAERYFSILRARDNLRYTQAERKAIEQQLQQAQSRYEVGLASVTDVKEAQASRDQAFASEIAAENALEIARENLRISIDQHPKKLAKLREDVPITGPKQAITDYLEQATEQQLQLKVQQASRNGAEHELSAARASRWPTLNATGSVESRNLDGAQADADTLSLGLSLNWQLYNGGKHSADIRQAKAQLEQQSALSEQQRRLTEQQVRQAYLNQVSSVNQVNALKEALRSTQVAYEATEAGYNVGTNTAVEVLLGLRETYRAQANYASARYDYLLSKLRLDQATGSLNSDSLAQIDRWLDGD